MLHQTANKFADWLIRNGADLEKREVVIYGVECAMNEVIANVIMFTIAFLLGFPLEMLIWNLFWLPPRVNLGGHHANSHLVCLIYSTTLAVGCVLFLPFISEWDWLLVIEIVSVVIITFKLAPCRIGLLMLRV